MYDCAEAVRDLNLAYPISGKIDGKRQAEYISRATDHILDTPCFHCRKYQVARKKDFERARNLSRKPKGTLTQADWDLILNQAWDPEQRRVLVTFKMFNGRVRPSGQKGTLRFRAVSLRMKKLGLPFRIRIDRSTQRFPIKSQYFILSRTV
jgi:hypothetical protein